MRVLSIDPGVTTGWVLWNGEVPVLGSHFVREGVIGWGQIGPKRGFSEEFECAETLVDLVFSEDGSVCDVVLIEDFILQGGSLRAGGVNKNRDGLSPVRITAVLLGLLRERCGWGVGCTEGEVVFQMPAQKDTITNQRLKLFDMWFVGKQHARDAGRHLLVYLRSA